MKNADMPAMSGVAATGEVFLGLTKRKYTATKAMQGLLSDPSYADLYDTPEEWRKNIVEASVEFADALLAELDKLEK